MAGADLYLRMELIAGRLIGAEQDLSLGEEHPALMRDVRAERQVRRAIKERLICQCIESAEADQKECH